MFTKAALLLWLFIDDCIVDGMQFRRDQQEQGPVLQSDVRFGSLNRMDGLKRRYRERANSRRNNSMYSQIHENENPSTHKQKNSPVTENRRFYWEPIFDGKVISSIGSLFSQDIKKESNRERLEREELHKQELREKYAKILNDPEKLKELQKQSANSPKFIQQVIRRSRNPIFTFK